MNGERREGRRENKGERREERGEKREERRGEKNEGLPIRLGRWPHIIFKCNFVIRVENWEGFATPEVCAVRNIHCV